MGTADETSKLGYQNRELKKKCRKVLPDLGVKFVKIETGGKNYGLNTHLRVAGKKMTSVFQFQI